MVYRICWSIMPPLIHVTYPTQWDRLHGSNDISMWLVWVKGLRHLKHMVWALILGSCSLAYGENPVERRKFILCAQQVPRQRLVTIKRWWIFPIYNTVQSKVKKSLRHWVHELVRLFWNFGICFMLDLYILNFSVVKNQPWQCQGRFFDNRHGQFVKDGGTMADMMA